MFRTKRSCLVKAFGRLSQSPQIGAMFRTEAEISFDRQFGTSQSPQIGAMFRTASNLEHLKIVYLSLNPLKSGLCFGLESINVESKMIEVSIPSNRGYVSDYEDLVSGMSDILSQSPQIGAMFRTQRIRIKLEWWISLNPLKSGLCFGQNAKRSCLVKAFGSLNPLKSGLCFGLNLQKTP